MFLSLDLSSFKSWILLSSLWKPSTIFLKKKKKLKSYIDIEFWGYIKVFLDALKSTDASPVEDLPRITRMKGGRTRSQMSWLLSGHNTSTNQKSDSARAYFLLASSSIKRRTRARGLFRFFHFQVCNSLVICVESWVLFPLFVPFSHVISGFWDPYPFLTLPNLFLWIT